MKNWTKKGGNYESNVSNLFSSYYERSSPSPFFLQRHPRRRDQIRVLHQRWHHLHHRHQNRRILRRFQESVLITTRRRLFSALRTGCVHLTARLVNNCRKYSAKRAAIKSHVWAHPLRPPNGASWDFIASCDISFFVRLRTGDRGCTNRKTVAKPVYAARSLALKNNRSTERTLNPKP